jgi:predicted transcriptional regulator
MTTVTDNELSERFEVAFNKIHTWLQKNIKNAKTNKYTELLRLGFPMHSIIRKHYDDLKIFGRLRNSIVHDKVEQGFYIAEPHLSVVEKIETIASKINEPRPALSIATKPVFYYFEDAKLKDILTVINRKMYSVYPIYNQNGFKWLLTAEGIIQWFSQNLVGNSVYFDEVRVQDLYTFSRSLLVEFVGKETDMFVVEEIFEEYHHKNKKLEAVIITETGKKSEKPQGIITSWDLVEIAAHD